MKRALFVNKSDKPYAVKYVHECVLRLQWNSLRINGYHNRWLNLRQPYQQLISPAFFLAESRL